MGLGPQGIPVLPITELLIIIAPIRELYFCSSPTNRRASLLFCSASQRTSLLFFSNQSESLIAVFILPIKKFLFYFSSLPTLQINFSFMPSWPFYPTNHPIRDSLTLLIQPIREVDSRFNQTGLITVLNPEP
jgi:hypothetical protein